MNSDDGWDFISQKVPVIVENSWAYGNGYVNSGRSRRADGDGNGFKIGSSKTGIRHVVTTSVALGNRTSGFYPNTLPWGPTGSITRRTTTAPSSTCWRAGGIQKAIGPTAWS